MKYVLLLLLIVPFVCADAVVKGVVLDSLDNLVGFAEIKLDCMEGSFSADKFGAFSVSGIPSGPCRVFAAYGDGGGFELVNIEDNQTMYIEVKLDKTIVNIPQKHNYLFPALIILIVLIVFSAILFKIWKKEKVLEKKVRAESHSARVLDVLKTLKPKEASVVEFLLQNRNESSQSKIRHATGLPRTSLARCLKDLESKKIICVERHGKLVKVRLSDWFLER
ncbi:hypothetical protein KY319_01375 [Candidatus Woesearchaeota archaeon]|nr:hypothetical protein [Candidatus Woesearchaeota archaeon]